jgi:heptosyltransferase-1
MCLLGLDPGSFEPEIVLSPADRKAAREIGEGCGLAPPYAVICPFTTRPQKHWVGSRWSETAAELVKQFNLAVALLGGPQDAAAASRLQRQTGDGVVDLAGRTTLGQAAALVEKAALVIGVDTGLTHLGTAFTRPTIALFGATCPYLRTPSPRTTVLYNRLACSPCKRSPTCDGRYDCMKSITSDDVCRAARRLMENGP